MRILLALFLLTGCAAAQNSDLGLLGGISGPKGQTTISGETATASGSVTPSFQVNYAWQVLQRTADLYVELPLVIPVRVSGTTVAGPNGAASAGSSGPDLFFTPGLRVKFSPESRVSFYAAAGVGIASFGATSTIVPPLTVVAGSRQNSFAIGFGGGIDFRLTRLLSLRVDARDFVTRAGLGGVSGRNHAILQVGIAFHF
jgi:opacity protein-like surface antigen